MTIQCMGLLKDQIWDRTNKNDKKQIVMNTIMIVLTCFKKEFKLVK